MEGHALGQVEGVGVSGLVIIPALGQTGHHVVIGVVGGQAIEDEQVDLAMLVDGRIDAGVVAAAVYQRAFGQGGRRGQQHQHRNQECKDLLHGLFSFSIFKPPQRLIAIILRVFISPAKLPRGMLF